MKSINWYVTALGVLIAMLVLVLNNPKPLEVADVVGDWGPVADSQQDTVWMKLRIGANGSYEFSKVPCYFVRFPVDPNPVELCDGKGEWRLPPDRANLIYLSGRNSSFSLTANGNRLRLDHRNVDSPVFVDLERRP